jgi:hypothetical protein
MRSVAVFLLAACFVAGCPDLAASVREEPVATPDALVARARRLAAAAEWSALYDLLDARAKGEVGRIEFVLGFKTRRTGPPQDYRVVDVLVKGDFIAAIADRADPGRAVVYYTYAEPGKPRLDVAVLVRREEGEWRIDGPVSER